MSQKTFFTMAKHTDILTCDEDYSKALCCPSFLFNSKVNCGFIQAIKKKTKKTLTPSTTKPTMCKSLFRTLFKLEFYFFLVYWHTVKRLLHNRRRTWLTAKKFLWCECLCLLSLWHCLDQWFPSPGVSLTLHILVFSLLPTHLIQLASKSCMTYVGLLEQRKH